MTNVPPVAAATAAPAPSAPEEIILEVSGLKQHFPIRQGLLQRVVGHVKAVDGVSFQLRAREALG